MYEYLKLYYARIYEVQPIMWRTLYIQILCIIEFKLLNYIIENKRFILMKT